MAASLVHPGRVVSNLFAVCFAIVGGTIVAANVLPRIFGWQNRTEGELNKVSRATRIVRRYDETKLQPGLKI